MGSEGQNPGFDDGPGSPVVENGGHLRGPLRWPWHSEQGTTVRPHPLPLRFFRESAEVVARRLLGTRLRSTLGQGNVEGVVVETEAYLGPHDPASHAAARIGRTQRNETMFGPPGKAYVYRSYGIHWCLNAVTGDEGYPAAVLIRALDPLRGTEEMVRARGGRRPLCSGPGRLCQALGVTGNQDGHPLSRSPLQLLEGWAVPEESIVVSGRIGVSQAADWPLRFYLEGNSEVSRGAHVRLP